MDQAVDLVSEVYQLWLVQDQMLFTLLLSSISPLVLPRFINCKQSWHVWDKVHNFFHSHLRTKIRQFRSELKNTKKGSRLINEYLMCIRALVDSLQAIGDPVTEQDNIDTILERLPEEFNPFVIMIYDRVEPATVDDIEALLIVNCSR